MKEIAQPSSPQPKQSREVVKSAIRLLTQLSERHRPADVPGALRTGGPSDSITSVATAGWIIVGLFFGVLGVWSLTAPLNGAVVANGVVKVEGNRKSVQHLDGGIVKELRVKEGDKVRAGDILIVLDDSQARAEYEVLTQQYYILRITEERLRVEYNRGTIANLPSDLADKADDPGVQSIWRAQIHQFDSRLAAVEGQRKVIQEKIAQLESQIKGADAQVKAYKAQFDSVQKELESITPLVDKGLIARPRFCNWKGRASLWKAKPPTWSPTLQNSSRRSPNRRSRLRSLTMIG